MKQDMPKLVGGGEAKTCLMFHERFADKDLSLFGPSNSQDICPQVAQVCDAEVNAERTFNPSLYRDR